MQHSLSTSGLSLSQAQSISNLCNQRCKTIESNLSLINNYSKSLVVNGVNYVDTAAEPIPSNTADLLKEKARLHATQAFLMENIKAKDTMLRDVRIKSYTYDVPMPTEPKWLEVDTASVVDESWGWDQLSSSEYNEYLEAEAYASHIGQFIHKGGVLDRLRNELPKIKILEWFEVEAGKKTPMTVTIHHTPEQLLAVHEQLATLHRQYEQRVNYFKAKVKNLVTVKNAEIAKSNAIASEAVAQENSLKQQEYMNEYRKWTEASKAAHSYFEEARAKEIANIAELRIAVPNRFQDVVDEFLQKLS